MNAGSEERTKAMSGRPAALIRERPNPVPGLNGARAALAVLSQTD